MNQVLVIIISLRWCGVGEDGTSVNGGTVLEYGGVISSGAGAAGIAPERTRAAESVGIGAPCDDDNQDDDSKNHDDAEPLSEAAYDYPGKSGAGIWVYQTAAQRRRHLVACVQHQRQNDELS